MSNSKFDFKKILSDRANKPIDLQYKIDMLKNTKRNDLLNLVKNLLSKDKK